MSRRRRAVTRELVPDARYHSTVVTTLVNTVMRSGNKSVAQRVVYDAVDKIVERNPTSNPMEILQRAVDNAKPRLEVKARRVGGATYQVPIEVSRVTARTPSRSAGWFGFANSRKGTPMKDALASEIMDAYLGQGSAIRKRDEVHKMAQSNKAFAHFRW